MEELPLGRERPLPSPRWESRGPDVRSCVGAQGRPPGPLWTGNIMTSSTRESSGVAVCPGEWKRSETGEGTRCASGKRANTQIRALRLQLLRNPQEPASTGAGLYLRLGLPKHAPLHRSRGGLWLRARVGPGMQRERRRGQCYLTQV